MSEAALATQGLTKRYGRTLAVDGLDLEVHRGEVFGLLGPNGSGKTTTILMLLGLTDPSGGELSIVGLDPRRQPLSVKRRVGYLPDTVGFYDELTGRDNLAYSAALLGMRRDEAAAPIEAVLERVGLNDAAGSRVRTYSRGMRQRLGLAELLLKNPEVAILDEPTLGLDPEAADWFLQTVRSLRDEGMTLLLSSHLLHQVQSVCDRVGLFANGRMLLTGTLDDLAGRVLDAAWRIDLETHVPDGRTVDLAAGLRTVPGVREVEPGEDGYWTVHAHQDIRGPLVRAALEAGAEVTGIALHRPQLDEIYRRYFGASTHEA